MSVEKEEPTSGEGVGEVGVGKGGGGGGEGMMWGIGTLESKIIKDDAVERRKTGEVV